MTAIENRIGGAWWAKQTAKGTPATTADKRGRWVAGDMNVARDDGNENYLDGQRFPDSVDFVNQVLGNGNPSFQGQSGVVAHLAYLMSGQETVTGAAAPYTHVATPNNTGSFWSTWWKTVGQTVKLQQKFNDAKLVSLRFEGSTAAKVLRVTPTFVSLDAGEVYTTDPIKADDGTSPILWTEAEAAISINGAVVRGQSSFAFVIGDAVTPWFGDSVIPQDVAYGPGTVTIENLTLLVDAAGLAHYNSQIYGTATPAAAAKPLHVQPALGSYTINFTRGTSEQVMIEVPGLRWTPDMAIPPNPDGGPVELAIGGAARKSGVNPMYRITTKNADPAYT